jgi:hypothetical protein
LEAIEIARFGIRQQYLTHQRLTLERDADYNSFLTSSPCWQRRIDLHRLAGEDESKVESVVIVKNVSEAERFLPTSAIYRGATNCYAFWHFLAYGPAISTFDYAEATEGGHAIATPEHKRILLWPRFNLHFGSDNKHAILEGSAWEGKLLNGIGQAIFLLLRVDQVRGQLRFRALA